MNKKLSEITKELAYNDILKMYAIDVDSGFIDPSQVVEQLIYRPSSEPQISLGTPNTIDIDLNNARQGLFEPRYDALTYDISVDFTLSFSNVGNGIFFSMFYSLSGTRIITFPSTVKCIAPSGAGVWDPNQYTLTLSTGTQQDVYMVLSKNETKSFWNLSVKVQESENKWGVYRPLTEPEISTGTITINPNDSSQSMFEPRDSVGTRTISTNFTLAFANVTSANLISCVFSFSGTVIITMPSNVLCLNASSIGTWDNILKTLELAAGTDDIVEFQFLKDKTSNQWLLKVSDIPLT